MHECVGYRWTNDPGDNKRSKLGLFDKIQFSFGARAWSNSAGGANALIGESLKTELFYY